MHGPHIDDPVSRQRFVAEAEITGGLEHPGVVPVYGLGTDSFGHPYYAMRFIKGDLGAGQVGRPG
jgi:eukaryotic-like serine/threonine-protein kinase